jgi:hypothetical protein
MFKLAADPKRWISVTAPLSASSALAPACPSRWRVMTRCTTCSTGVTSLGRAASSRRSGMGNASTHWRTGTWGMTWSTRCAAVCAARRAPHEGQKPRFLQLNATSLSCPQSPQRSRRKPWARMPHSRKASNSPCRPHPASGRALRQAQTVHRTVCVRAQPSRTAARRRRLPPRPARRRWRRVAAPAGTAWSARGGGARSGPVRRPVP